MHQIYKQKNCINFITDKSFILFRHFSENVQNYDKSVNQNVLHTFINVLSDFNKKLKLYCMMLYSLLIKCK